MRDNAYVGIGSANPGSLLSFGNPIVNKILTLWDGNAADPTSTATNFYGFGINAGTLRYQVDTVSAQHAFYGGTSLFATIANPTTFNYNVITPNRYYVYGCLQGGQAGAVIVNLLTPLSSGGGLGITSSNRIVAPISGLYYFGFNTIYNNSGGRCDIYIYVNGSPIVNTLSEDATTGFHYRSGSTCRYLSANDYVQFFNASANSIYSGAGAGTANDTWRTYFFYHIG